MVVDKSDRRVLYPTATCPHPSRLYSLAPTLCAAPKRSHSQRAFRSQCALAQMHNETFLAPFTAANFVYLEEALGVAFKIAVPRNSELLDHEG
ncbi:hypothetical protein HBH56_147080 [Parastagonospora nodorum]|uniref:Uncharacterized protein n=1 Tax=Phaeosphaeria nodorum (strain SN15 / ATCC MYA-4574 / FGSC 10173) TaxID=321614 RepID=A0A7U2HZP1_PHANO|nr:hypothetical protein HBH56_147080 [Parastagonospora nodorum]QRC94002.1 hypothetical protein JI435_430080 [Parastagonospora nodorum SN15]KAH3923277.1 hypothetical protein HBH54_211720 [Parastagonospora nodorum]KAH3945972.1 hypothetical protein HBH53_134540 [Parastagonospora nodorum]KAH3983927.1 hypothetical protein HBH52_065500 [Parastagonospora nodorum]